jgi:hypothetical protein
MSSPSRRLPVGRSSLWVIGALVILVAVLYNVRALRPWRSQAQDPVEADPALIGELRQAELPPAKGPDVAPGDWPQWRGPRRDGVSREKFEARWPSAGTPLL